MVKPKDAGPHDHGADEPEPTDEDWEDGQRSESKRWGELWRRGEEGAT